MGLQRLKTALGAAEFTPHALTVGATPDLAGALSPPAREFSQRAWGPQATAVELLSPEPWGEDLLRRFRSLGEDERLEVLGCAGFLNHEVTHRIDFLTTPFGAAFQGRACLETIGLLLQGAGLIAALERDDPHRPLRDVPPLSDEAMVDGSGLAAVNARIRWFDALRGAAPKHLQRAWTDGVQDKLSLAGKQLDPVMVHELMPTVSIPGTDGAYLRPLTILESRAVAQTGLLLLNRLGGDAFAAAEVARFTEAFYTPREAFPDYRFFLDLFLEVWRAEDFSSLVEEHGPESLATTLKAISVVGWYGLHVSPEAGWEAHVNTSPMLRAVVALQDLVAALKRGDNRFEAVPFLDGVDASDRAAALGLTGSRVTIARSAQYLDKVRRHNLETNPHPELKAHFESVLSIQQRQLVRRHERGYEFAAGMPEDGSVVYALRGDAADPDLIGPEIPPPPGVHRWFRLREMLLFRHARPPGFWEELWQIVGDHESAASARERALGRAMFVADGVWAVDGTVWDTEEGPRAALPVRPARLPATFRGARAGEASHIQTAWNRMVFDDQQVVALAVRFLDFEEETKLLFDPRYHRAQLEAILASGIVVILTDEALHAVGNGQPHAEIVHVPVTADAGHALSALA